MLARARRAFHAPGQCCGATFDPGGVQRRRSELAAKCEWAATWSSGLLSGPLTGSLLHSLNFNIGSLEECGRARKFIFARRRVSAKTSLSRRRSPPLSVPMARSCSRSRRARRPSLRAVPPGAWPAASSETRACETGANASVTRRRLWTPRVMWLVSRGRALVYLHVGVCLASRVAAMPACACLRVGAASFGLPRSIVSTVLSVVVVVRCGLAALRKLLDEKK